MLEFRWFWFVVQIVLAVVLFLMGMEFSSGGSQECVAGPLIIAAAILALAAAVTLPRPNEADKSDE